MDILEIIAENIEARDINAVDKLVDHFVKQGLNQKNINLFITFFLNLFAKRFINRNNWLLNEFAIQLDKIDTKSKDKDICVDAMKSICFLLTASDIKDESFQIIDIMKKSDPNLAREILYKHHREYEDLLEFKKHLDADVYGLINIIYHNMAYSINITDIYIMVEYLLTNNKKKKELLLDSFFTDIYDMLFTLLMTYIECNRLSPDVAKYVTTCKSLFYYKCSLKDKPKRLNMLLYAIHVLVTKRTKFQEIVSYKPIMEKPLNYLFVLTRNDRDLSDMVKYDKMNRHIESQINQIKYVDVKEWLDQTKVTVIKDTYLRQ